jgi:hypothetical protein
MDNQQVLIVIISLIIVIIYHLYNEYQKKYAQDYAQIHSVPLKEIKYPRTEDEIIHIITSSNDPICIAGSKFSHGGQTMATDSIQLNLQENYNDILWFDPDLKEICVQSGITWKKIIEFIDPFHLSVIEMQSYANFSVGGSISVNCHGRGMRCGTLVETIKEMTVINHQGIVYKCSPQMNSRLFSAIVGGYGSFAVISTVTLFLEDNCLIKKYSQEDSVSNIQNVLLSIRDDPDVVFYNGNIYPSQENKITHVMWNTNNDFTNPTITDRIQNLGWIEYTRYLIGEQLLRRLPFFKPLRYVIETADNKNSCVVWKNYEMTYDTTALQPWTKVFTTSILQEYFVPLENINIFLQYFWEIVHDYKVNILNVSIRWVKGTTVPCLTFCPQDRIAVVIYFNIANTSNSVDHISTWSELLTDCAYQLGGSYYLPYLPCVSRELFQKCYPRYEDFFRYKRMWDPENKFTNMWLKKYIL